MTLTPNTTLQGGKYRILSMLGQGGFGITYLALHTQLDVKVAIKEFFMKDFCERGSDSHVSLGSSGSREMVERFRAKFIKEAQNIARLRHANIVRVTDVFEDNGTAYYVMEYHDGGSLADLVKSRGHLSESEAVGYARQIADALGYLHARKINHLDVKPANVLLNDVGEAVLIDFGLAKHYDSEGNQTSTTPVGISHGYAPMEQYRRGGVGTFSPTSDIYSLGATLYKMLTGVTPPEASDLLNEGLPPMTVAVSPAVRNAVEQAMAPLIKDRPQSIGEFLALLNGETPVVGVVVDDEKTNVVVEEKTTIEPEVEPESTTTVEKTTVPPTPEPTPEPTPKPAEKPKSRKGLIIGVIWVLICALVVAVAGVYMSNQQKVAEEQSLAEEQHQVESPAELYTKGKDLYDEKQYAEAVPYFRQAAEQGSADAQFFLGACYYFGEGVKNDSEAVKWYLKAAEQGHAKAQYNLGVCYYNGEGVSENYSEAVKWYLKSAEQGYAKAQYNLGICYEYGNGVPQSYAKAVEWYRKSAEQGDAKAQYNLGWCYYNGKGVTKSYAKAVEWYRKAAEQGNASAQNNLGTCYYNGAGVPQSYAKAVEWYRKSAEQGHADAQYNLGVCYEYGNGVPQSYAKAVEWYRKAAEQGNALAQYNLGGCYYRGEGVPQDYAKAVEWFQKSAEQGYATAQEALEELREMGY